MKRILARTLPRSRRQWHSFKEIKPGTRPTNSRAQLGDADMKPLFYLVVFSSALVHAQQCRIGGQVFFSDVVDHTVTIKTDSGDLVNFNYDSATIFLRAAPESQQNAGANRVLPEALNNGDRLCVGASKPAVVTVTPRQEIDSQQKRELAAWQADSLYGVVSGLERQTRQPTLPVPVLDQTTSYSFHL